MPTIAVPVEVVRELKEYAKKCTAYSHGAPRELNEPWIRMVVRLPPLPKPDVVDECARAYSDCLAPHVAPCAVSETRMRAALRRYRDLGCPELDE